jgi:ATP-dependent DNA helicase RecG
MSERMTSQSLRDRFQLTEDKAATVSQVISATMEAGLIKPDQSAGGSRRFARSPFWAWAQLRVYVKRVLRKSRA